MKPSAWARVPTLLSGYLRDHAPDRSGYATALLAVLLLLGAFLRRLFRAKIDDRFRELR